MGLLVAATAVFEMSWWQRQDQEVHPLQREFWTDAEWQTPDDGPILSVTI
jgi:hypothetical protein